MPTKLKIAYIDDDEDDVLIFKEIFHDVELKDFYIKDYRNGEELLKALDHQVISPNLFVIDMNMPRMNGIELATAVKSYSQFSQSPIVIFSTGITPIEKDTCAQLNISCIKKPLALAEWKNTAYNLASLCQLRHA